MPISEAKKQANKKWNDANMNERYDRVQLVLPKGMKEEIQSCAVREKVSLSAYIKQAVEEQVKRDDNDFKG